MQAKEHFGLSPRPVDMDFTVGTIESDGTKHILSKPKMVVKENEQGNITTSPEQNNNKEYVTLSVMLQRIYRK